MTSGEERADVSQTSKAAAVVEAAPVESATPPWRRRPTGLTLDALIAAVLFIIATLLGTAHIQSWAGTPSFYQEFFGAAVSVGCGEISTVSNREAFAGSGRRRRRRVSRLPNRQ